MAANRPTQAGIGELLWLFFIPTGRISRNVYWLSLAFVFCIALPLGQIWGDNVLIETGIDGAITAVRTTPVSDAALLAMLPLQWSAMVVIGKRCRDQGLPPFLAILWLVPFINVALCLFVGLSPGTPGANRYGRDRDRPPS